MPQKDNGDNDFHVLTVCAEIIMMKEKVIVILNDIIISIHLFIAYELAMMTTTTISRKQRQPKDKVTLHSN